MRRIIVIFIPLIFVSLVSAVAVAQGPPMGMGPGGPGPHGMMGSGPNMEMHHGHFGAWWKNSEVVKELQLTDAQVKQIEQTFLDYRLKLIDLRADVERQETKLQPLLEADQPNEQQVSSQVDAVVAARGRLEKTNTLMMLAIRRVLSVDQWKKLQSIEHRRGERRVIIRRGGPDEHEEHMHDHGDGPDMPPSPPRTSDNSQ